MQSPQSPNMKVTGSKKGFHILTYILYIAIFVLLIASAYIALQINNNVSLQKPKAVSYTCQWCTNKGQCDASGITPWTSDAKGACGGSDGCCGSFSEVQPTPSSATGNCTIDYSAKCISLSGNCTGRTIRTFVGDYTKGCPNQGGSDQTAQSGSQYCANADYGKCVQVDLLGGGGVCDCKAGSATGTPVPAASNTPALTNTPTLTPTPTSAITATPTVTPAKSPTPAPTTAFSPTPTLSPTPIPPTTIPGTVSCGEKGCDTNTNPCKSGLVCVLANDGSKYCSVPALQAACVQNSTQASCCTNPTQPPPGLKAAATRVPTMPVTGGIPLPVIIIPPAILLLLGLLL